jgi:dienelactone hydrolase
MKVLSSIVLLGVAWGGYHALAEHRAARELQASSDVYGFLDVPSPSNQNPDTIYVVAAENCPHAAAQAADRLAKQLGAQGMPVVRTSNVSFNSQMDPKTFKRLKRVMEGPLPLVFIHGRAASNPETDQVMAEYRQSIPVPTPN